MSFKIFSKEMLWQRRPYCDRWLREVREQRRATDQTWLGIEGLEKKGFWNSGWKTGDRRRDLQDRLQTWIITLKTVWSVLTRTSLSSGFTEFSTNTSRVLSGHTWWVTLSCSQFSRRACVMNRICCITSWTGVIFICMQLRIALAAQRTWLPNVAWLTDGLPRMWQIDPATRRLFRYLN